MLKAYGYYLDVSGLSYDDIHERYFHLIESSRKSRIEKCVRDDPKKMLLYTGAALGSVLKRFGASAEDVVLSDKGKPFVKGRDDLYFNISHSGQYIVIVAAPGEIGTDIQKPVKVTESLVRRIASDKEREAYKDLINDRFNLFWAVKESYSKLTGDGIGTDFAGVRFEFEGGIEGEFGLDSDSAKILYHTQAGFDDKQDQVPVSAFGKAVYITSEFPVVTCMYSDFTIDFEPLSL